MAGALKGVMRVGVLAKGLLLHERLDVNLVVLCHGKKSIITQIKLCIWMPWSSIQKPESKVKIWQEHDEPRDKHSQMSPKSCSLCLNTNMLKILRWKCSEFLYLAFVNVRCSFHAMFFCVEFCYSRILNSTHAPHRYKIPQFFGSKIWVNLVHLSLKNMANWCIYNNSAGMRVTTCIHVTMFM